MTITNEQIKELEAFARHTANSSLLTKCAMALAPSRGRATSVDLAREHCEHAYVRLQQDPEWAARHLPFGAFRVAEMIAQFVLDEAQEYEHLPSIHDALVNVATRIRTADWIKGDGR